MRIPYLYPYDGCKINGMFVSCYEIGEDGIKRDAGFYRPTWTEIRKGARVVLTVEGDFVTEEELKEAEKLSLL